MRSFLVGVSGLEPEASWSRTKRATSCAIPRRGQAALTSRLPYYYRHCKPLCQELAEEEFLKKQIVDEYNGYNIKQLATKYGYSEKWVRQILKEHIDKQKSD